MTAQDDRDQREQDRLAELDRYQVLDTEPEAAFDELVKVAAAIARTPVAAVSLVDRHRQWFKATVGLDAPGTPRDIAFCDLVVQDDAELIVGDTHLEPRLAQNPDVVGGPRYRFYAGFPLRTPSGAVLGTLCVIDQQPRVLSEDQLYILRTLSEQVMAQLQLRRELQAREQLMAERNEIFDKLVESEQRYRFLVENSSDVIAQHRPDGSVIYVSPTVQGMLGVAPHSPEDWNLLERVHPDDLEAFTGAFMTCLTGRSTTANGRMRHADGSYRFLEITLKPITDDDQNVVEILATTRDATERRLAELELDQTKQSLVRQSELLELAQELAEVGSWATDLRTQVVVWSREAHRLMGTDPGMALDTETIWQYIHPDDHSKVRSAVGAAFAQGRSDDVEFRITREADDARRTLRSRFRVDKDEYGQPLRLSGTMLDITETRETELALVQARDLLDQVMSTATKTAVIGVGTDGLINVFNLGAQNMLGYRADEMLGTRGYLRFHVAQEIAERAARLGVSPEGGRVFVAATDSGDDEWTLIRRDGVRIRGQLSVSEMTDFAGQPSGLIGFLNDVTDARRTQQELIEANDLFNQLLSSATAQAIIGTDIDGVVSIFNRGAEIMLGYTAEEIVGTPNHTKFHDPDDLPKLVELFEEFHDRGDDHEVLSRADVEPPDWTYVRKDGTRLKVQIRFSPMRGSSGGIVGYVGVATDVTRQRDAERERDRAEQDVQAAMIAISQARDEALAANQAKSAFLATMSHEIRTPMNAVIGMTGLLLDTELDDDQRDLIETVRGSGDQLLAIINDILDFSKIEAGDLDLEYRAFDLRDLVEGTVAQFAGTAKGLDLISHVDDACPAAVVGDSTRLRQVLSNLVSNAIKFTADGEVLVRVGCDHGTGGGKVRLNFLVQDSGIGIPEESMHRLFKSFSQVDASTTRNYGGTGLGLAISKALVNAMGGEISVSSELGVGSTFAFSSLVGIDESVPELRPGRMDADHLRAALSGRRVLIVDDNATNRRILTLQLKHQGMQTVDVSSPIDALQLLSDASQRFDLAILDLAMPVLDGVQLATAIRRLPLHSGLPLLLLSSIGRRLGADEELFTGVLTKPVRSVALVESMARAMDSASRERSPSWPPASSSWSSSSRSGGPAVGRTRRPPVPTPGTSGDDTDRHGDSAAASLRILLAEDNEVNQKVGRLMLAKLGHAAVIVENGEQALAAAREGQYDVILMDMHMPVMDGLEATRRIRAELSPDRQPRIVALTASVTLEDREACAAAGMDGYLSKPVRPHELAATIAAAQPVNHA